MESRGHDLSLGHMEYEGPTGVLEEMWRHEQLNKWAWR